MLNKEIVDRIRLGAELTARERLEPNFRERTDLLKKTIAALNREIDTRTKIEQELRETERRVTISNELLRESEARYRSLIEDVRDIIFTVRADGTIDSLSPAFEPVTGFSRDELIGKHFSALLHPEDRKIAAELFNRIISGDSLPLFELRGRIRRGEYRFFEFKIASARLEQGMILGIARDITDRKLAEEDNARLASAVQSAAEAVVITSPSSGVIKYVNPAFEQMTGYTKEEALGRTLHILDSGKHDKEYYRQLRDTLAREGVWKGKLFNRKKDGALYFEECTVSPVINGNRQIINYVHLKRDVTEKARLESIAEAVNTMNNIGYVFAGISHEIGNPISSLVISLDLLKEKLETGQKEALSEYMDRIMAQVGKIEYLLASLRNFNMYEIQELKDVRVDSFINQFLSLTSEDFTNKGIVVRALHAPDVDYACMDPRALQQVMLNVFTNAADALVNRQCPRIEVRTSRSRSVVCIRITDNGCGMTGEQREKLFTPFYTSKPHGTGLGLVIIKNMLAKMGGTIEIESSRDEGTSVTITIPEGGNGRR